jgi:SAM-dependent methyltransferase
MRWPLPALLTWAAAWLAYRAGLALGLGWMVCGLLALAVSALGATFATTRWRSAFIVLGFPLSWVLMALSGRATAAWATPALNGWAWLWLVPLLALLVLYPRRAWRDAPLFPTPEGALQGLVPQLSGRPLQTVLDAGCGLGAGLREWRRVLPEAHLTGWEWSWPLRILCALRCPWATVRRCDIWAQPWQGFDVVYLFQRPESMARAFEKAHAELAPGAWLVSLEFPVPGRKPDAQLQNHAGKPVWAYRMPGGRQQKGRAAR